MNLKERIVTGIIGGGVFLGFLWAGWPWFLGVVMILALGTYFEYIRMRKANGKIPLYFIGFVYISILLIFELSQSEIFTLVWTTVFLFLFLSVISKNRVSIEDISYAFLGLFYIAFGFYFMNEVRNVGLEWTLLTIALVWGTDSGAYFTGRYLGRHKLWPEISPKKTIEGAIGGILTAMVISLLFYLFGQVIPNFWVAILIGFVISIVDQLGDLFESAIKRTFNIKDSGKVFPGHGGFFDRFDSMIAVFPVMYFLLTIFA